MPPTIENEDQTPEYEGQSQYTPRVGTSNSPTTSANNNSGKGPPLASGANSPYAGAGGKHAADYLDGLRALPEVRPIPWIPGKELPPEKATESQRSQTRGAFLLATRGMIRNPPCTHCATGAGRFAVCVSMGSWFRGSCATCQMGTRGNLCSLRREIEGHEDLPGVENEADEAEEPTKGTSSEIPQSQSSLKRKRGASATVESPMTLLPRVQSSPRVHISPYPPSVTPQGPSYIPTSVKDIPSGTIIPAGSAFLLDFADQQQYPPNGTKRRHALSHAQVDSQGPSSATNGHVNKPGGHPHADGRRQIGTRGGFRSNLHPTSAQLQAIQPRPVTFLQDSSAPFPRAGAKRPFQPEAPLVDTIPSRKRKQIFSIIGGLQSGIRNARQQADNLQKQLDLLQAALGMDDEAEDEGDAGSVI